ncbi:MFS transporter [Lichenicola sp.]|uniref:MFS transporter n=1 Tax=Lichenicola sp. TaxID=2804529 RepID=UPI003B006D50
MSETTSLIDMRPTRLTPAEPAGPAKAAWAAVFALALGVFALVTAEFLPASLLTPMAHGLGVSNGTAGQAVTATALVGAFAGPIVVVGLARFDRRMIVRALVLLLVLSNLLAATASSVWILLGARVVLGFALGGFWSLAPALCLRLVPQRMVARAISIIFTGVSAATVCAAPLGAYLGDVIGWRLTFLSAGGLSVVALLALLVTLPRLPATDAPGLGTFLVLLRRPRIQVGMLTLLLVISGHFAGFTYVRPFLEQVSHLHAARISLVLLAFGVGGFFGNLAGGAIAGRNAKLGVGLASLLLAAASLLLLGYGAAATVTFVALTAWGFAFGALPVALQTLTTQSAPDHAESAGALLVTMFQIAIATGAILGGLLVDGFGARGAIGYCGLGAVAGTLVMLTLGRRGAASGSGVAA